MYESEGRTWQRNKVTGTVRLVPTTLAGGRFRLLIWWVGVTFSLSYAAAPWQNERRREGFALKCATLTHDTPMFVCECFDLIW
jgi:hypothetical protein